MSSSVKTFQEQQEFQAGRMLTVGGSEVPNLFGLEPYYCDRRLAYVKTSEVPDFPFVGNSATDRGQRYEKFAADIYSEKTGRTIRRVQPKADGIIPLLRPIPDFEIVNDARGPQYGRGMLSVKVPGREAFVRLKAAMEWLRGREANTEWEQQQRDSGLAMLRPYLLQGHAECAAQNVKWFSFAFLWMDGEQLEYADVDADGEIMDEIRARVRVFWDTKESKGVEGFPRLDPKSKQCGRCEFRVTCQSANLLKLLESANKDVEGRREVATIPQLDAAVRTLWERQDLEAEATALVAEAKDGIRAILSDCDAGEGFEVRVYNSLRAGRQTVNRDRLLKFAKEISERASVLLAHTEDKELNVSEFILAASLLLDDVAKIDKTIEEKFVSRGQPYRELRTYALPKKKSA